jgi:hypothetical protein
MVLPICGRRDSNPHGLSPPAPKAGASANFATPAWSLAILGGRLPVAAGGATAPQLLQPCTPGGIVRGVPPVKTVTPGYVVVYPNREKVTSKVTKAIVSLILLVSVALMLTVTIGGWSKLQGMKPVNIGWCIVYLIIAFYVQFRWTRGLLPIAAALAILLLILAVIAGTGVSGTSWFDRNHAGYAAPHTVFGGKGLGPDFLGLLTVLIAPVQVLLIFFSMQGFLQGWNVETEVPEDEARRRGYTPGTPAPAAA